MTNTLVTPTGIAKEALMRLSQKLVLAALVYKNYDPNFVGKKGDTARIKKPITFTAQDFSTTVTVQDIVQGYVDVTLNKHKDVTFALTAKELSLSIDEFAKDLIDPAVDAIAQSVEEALAGLYIDVPYFGTYDGTTETTKLAGIAAARQKLNQLGVPQDGLRRFVLGPKADAGMLVVPSFINAEKKGDTQALKEAALGRIMGFNFYNSTKMITHDYGGDDYSGDVETTANAGATSVAVHALGTGHIHKGTVLTFADDSVHQYVLTADAAITTNLATCAIYPALAQQEVATTVVTFQTNAEESLAFHQNAFCLASAALAKPAGAAYCEVVTYEGLACRVIADYNSSTKADQVSVDFLFGVKTLCPEMAYRFRMA
jgi:hypothetical protein